MLLLDAAPGASERRRVIFEGPGIPTVGYVFDVAVAGSLVKTLCGDAAAAPAVVVVGTSAGVLQGLSWRAPAAGGAAGIRGRPSAQGFGELGEAVVAVELLARAESAPCLVALGACGRVLLVGAAATRECAPAALRALPCVASAAVDGDGTVYSCVGGTLIASSTGAAAERAVDAPPGSALVAASSGVLVVASRSGMLRVLARDGAARALEEEGSLEQLRVALECVRARPPIAKS